MTLFTLANLLVGVASTFAGVLLLLGRGKVLAFVRSRFEKICREDGLAEEDVAGRVPRMTAVVLIGSGVCVVGVMFLLVALLRS